MARDVCKICGRGPSQVRFYDCPTRRGLLEYCVECNPLATNRKRWLKMHRLGTLGAAIATLEEQVEEMKIVRAREDADLHPINWKR